MTIAAFPSKVPTAAESARRLLREREAAVYLGVSTAYLRKQRLYGSTARTPAVPFIKIGARGIRYSIDDLNEWIASRRVER